MKDKKAFEALLMGIFSITWVRVWFVFAFLWLSNTFVLKSICFAVSLTVESILHQKLFSPLQMSLPKRILLHVLSYAAAICLALYMLSGTVSLQVKMSSLALFPG